MSCGKNYKNKSAWYTHRKYECGKEKGFKCSICAFKTHRKSTLKTHLLTHYKYE